MKKVISGEIQEILNDFSDTFGRFTDCWQMYKENPSPNLAEEMELLNRKIRLLHRQLNLRKKEVQKK